MSHAPASAKAETDLAEGLFPPCVLVATSSVDPADEAHLFAEEQLLVATAVARRRREFASARCLARALLARLGEQPRPLLRTPDRAPSWPAGVVGSISHCEGRVAAAVARRDDLAGLGIDIEPDAAIDTSLWDRICTPAEIERLPGPDAEVRGRAVRLLFSAKEALYKCVHPYAGRFIGFREVEIGLGPDGHFSASMPEDVLRALPAEDGLSGSFARRDGWILTGTILKCLETPPSAVRKTR